MVSYPHNINQTSRHVHSTETSNQLSSSHEQVQAIIILRSGKTIDKTILPSDPKGKEEVSKVAEDSGERKREPNEHKEIEGVPREKEKKSEKGNGERKENSGSIPKGEEALGEEHEILAHTPFPHRRLNLRENAFLTKDVHSVVQVKTPPKYEDSGCPTIVDSIP
ncbi:hypothetical protein Acr_10g0007390 [Actinidia rufa]|uniref:Uncharacterized protein n=1 Tax=Actinidia rufa TaxID=165716 RepID=A0A7J0F9H4_9ERIC|nr:hypothetical protein Acr_10g0007390 [Actinidia rufa]